MSNFDASAALYEAIKRVVSDQFKGLPYLTCKVGVVLADLGSGRFRVATNNVASTAISVYNFPLTVGVTVFILSSPNGDYIVGNYANNIDLSQYFEYFPIREWSSDDLPAGTAPHVFETKAGDPSFQCNEFVVKYHVKGWASQPSIEYTGEVYTQEGLIAPFSYEVRSDLDVYGRLHFVLDDKWSYDGSRIRSDMTGSHIEAVPFTPDNEANGYASKIKISFNGVFPPGSTVKLLGKQGGLAL